MFSFNKLTKFQKIGAIILFLFGAVGGFLIIYKCQENCLLGISSSETILKHEQKATDHTSLGKIVADGPEQFAKPCTNNSECIKVDLPPCGCNAGGRATAILKSKQRDFMKYTNRHSSKVLCTQQISNDPTCKKGVVAACVDNRCVLVETNGK